MAQPPDISETFVREVDENLRRDRLRDFAKAYGNWIIGGIILFLAASGGLIWWQQHQIKRSGEQAEQLAQVYREIGAGQAAQAPKQLDDLSGSDADAIRASALFTRAALALQQNDQKLAVAKYRDIAADGSLPDPYRNAALIRQTALEFDQLKPEQVISRLEPFAAVDSPWFGTAGELTALALIKQGKKAEAGRLFLAIAKDKDAPASVRDRAVQIAGSLGVDVSDVIPARQ